MGFVLFSGGNNNSRCDKVETREHVCVCVCVCVSSISSLRRRDSVTIYSLWLPPDSAYRYQLYDTFVLLSSLYTL